MNVTSELERQKVSLVSYSETLKTERDRIANINKDLRDANMDLTHVLKLKGVVNFVND
jgi:hypothetical protein